MRSSDVGWAIGLGMAAVGAAALFGSLWSDQTEEKERERQRRRNF